MKSLYLLPLAVAALAAGASRFQAQPAPAIAVAPVIAAVPELPTVEAPFAPVVRAETVQIPPTHAHLQAEFLQCQADQCALSVVAKTGLPEVEADVAIWGNSRTIYTAQLEPDGPWVENADLDGNGHWNEHDYALLMALVEGE